MGLHLPSREGLKSPCPPHCRYVDKIEVESPKGETFTFPCGSWFGANEPGEEGGPLRRKLLPSPTTTSQLRSRPLTRPVQVGDSLRPPLSLLGVLPKSRPKPPLAPPSLLQTTIAACALPHPDKVRSGIRAINRRYFGQGGEDTYFYAEAPSGHTVGLGVADGVYMWR